MKEIDWNTWKIWETVILLIIFYGTCAAVFIKTFGWMSLPIVLGLYFIGAKADKNIVELDIAEFNENGDK